MVLTLTDIIHLRKVILDLQLSERVVSFLTDEQKAKLTTIENLIEQIGTPTTTEELDATITALTEIRDK